jgi:hypothetical protein
MRKGVSEVVGIVLLIFMVVAVSGSFYYWYSAGQDEAQVKTEIFQADIFDQVVSRTSAILDATYNTNREVNVNNFAEYKTRLCADEKPLVLDSSDIRLELYEGYGAETNIICAESGFEGGCNTNETTLYGVLGGDSSTKGIYIVKSTDGTAWTTSGVSSAYEDYGKFNFTYLDLFVEGNNDTIDPKNMLLMGSGRHSTTGNRKSVLTIINNKLEGSSYDIADLDENVTVYYDAALLQDVPGGLFNLFRSGAIVDPVNSEPKAGILTRQFTVYDAPERLPSLGAAGRVFGGTKITAIQPILRFGVPQLLLGVTGNIEFGSISFIDETRDLVAGMEVNYLDPGTVCPYNIQSFVECGITVDPIACDISFDGIPDMIHVPEFSNSSRISHSAPIFIGVNNLTNGTHKIPSIFYTGYSEGDSSNIHCLNLETIGVDPKYEIIEMKYHKQSQQVLVFMTDQTRDPGFQIVAITDGGGDYEVNALSPPVPSRVIPITFDTLGDFVFISGTNKTHAIIERVNVTSGSVGAPTVVYVNDTYPELQKFLTYTSCIDRKPYCKEGCSKTIKRGDCTDLVLSIEDSACDISGYAPETTFTVRLGIGQFFQNLEIFTKKTGTSDEVNATEFN